MRELKLEELTTRQKLGMLTIATLFTYTDKETQQEQLDYVLELVKDHSVGAVWVNFDNETLDVAKEKIDAIKAVADYPVLIMCDAENGIGDKLIGMHNALGMHGIVAKFGKERGIGLSVGNGNDIALAWELNHQDVYEAMCKSYDKGIISDERLDEAVRRILEAQHKTLAQPKYTELTEKDLDDFDRINRDSVLVKVDEGIQTALSRDGKHFFAILTETTVDINNRAEVDTFSKEWYSPLKISDRLNELYPNSELTMISQFPSVSENMRVLRGAENCDDVVFVTFFRSCAYLGREAFTPSIITLMEVLQITDRISTAVHFGKPYVFEDLPHIPRVIIGTCSPDNTLYALDVLAGKYPSNGKLTNDVKFN